MQHQQQDLHKKAKIFTEKVFGERKRLQYDYKLETKRLQRKGRRRGNHANTPKNRILKRQIL